MKYTINDPAFGAALDAFGLGWKRGVAFAAAPAREDAQPSFAYALDAFGTALPAARGYRIADRCDDYDGACSLDGTCAC